MQETFSQIENLIKEKHRILLFTHSKIDGDALGSILSMYLFLKRMGKDVTAICQDPVPEVFKFLPTTDVLNNDFNGARDFIVTLNKSRKDLHNLKYSIEDNKVNIIITPKNGALSEKDFQLHQGEVKYDLIITLDTPSLAQLGSIYENNTDIFVSMPIVNIDHHVSNKRFGQINYIDVKAASTTEILFNYFQFIKKDQQIIDKDIATLLLAGIITDTGSFQNANTTPKSLEIAADLFDLGANQQAIIKNIYKTKKLSTLKLWGRVLSNLKHDPVHRIVWSPISQQDFKDTSATDKDTAGIIDELMSNTPGAEIFLLIKERENNILSGSIRTSSPDVSASQLASIYNGGGHAQAAGFQTPIEKNNFIGTVDEVISKFRNFQKKRLELEEKKEFNIPLETDKISNKDSIKQNIPHIKKKLEPFITENKSIEKHIKPPLPDDIPLPHKQKQTREKKIIDINQTLRDAINNDENNN